MSGFSRTELCEACSVLFGSRVDVSLDFFRYLQPSGLRAAYLKKALETHPDRAKALGRDEARLNELFKEVSLAYERLSIIIRDGETVLLNDKPDSRQKKRKTPSRRETYRGFSDHFYTGSVPRRELLIGRFLYYSGLLSWRTLIKAITWQWRQRPLIGQIALEWGMLSAGDIQMILKERNFGERFGEFAIRKGYLSTFELMALLGKQRGFHHLIGEYFVKQGIISSRDMDSWVERQWIHNKNITWGNCWERAKNQ